MRLRTTHYKSVDSGCRMGIVADVELAAFCLEQFESLVQGLVAFG
jgi:hypothetical protein